MTPQCRQAALIVFARAPVPGKVKTRLIPALGVRGAAQFYQRLLHKTVSTAGRAGFGCIELYCFPDTGHAVFQDLAARYPLKLRRQQGTDLGSRMHQAMACALERHSRVILIGSDCPQITAPDLRDAAAGLSAGCPVVLGPARDGGYVLIGAWTATPDLFTDMPWGTDQVLDLTRRRLRQSGWRWRELREFQDMDRPDDLRCLPADWMAPGLPPEGL